MAGKLSFPQEAIVPGLWRGEAGTMDARSLAGLRTRGLVEREPGEDGQPELTLEGLKLGALLHAEDNTRRLEARRQFRFLTRGMRYV
ncbi:hypothetical protein ACFQ1E_08135 [Sphingomonas canadensis]|uniref:Uncharacterized protein n=1 Tax=Sphingomonas canadensis TaxID=1219257 RepID=A0ABW3H483_9SPHN|nr:hypothetical protein [Sphingomonas canadensis]MCW3836005.1 hypothetical protein [Sphingomonas canadensis]